VNIASRLESRTARTGYTVQRAVLFVHICPLSMIDRIFRPLTAHNQHYYPAVISFICALHSSPHCAHKRLKMAPKKASAISEKKVILGRPGNNLKVGIVGLFQKILTIGSY